MQKPNRTAMKSNRPDIVRLTNKADAAFKNRDFSESFKIYRRIEKAVGQHPGANFKLALMYMEQSEQKKALIHFKKLRLAHLLNRLLSG